MADETFQGWRKHQSKIAELKSMFQYAGNALLKAGEPLPKLKKAKKGPKRDEVADFFDVDGDAADGTFDYGL